MNNKNEESEKIRAKQQRLPIRTLRAPSELGKTRKEEGPSVGDFTQVLSRSEKKTAKRDKSQQHAASSERPLFKIKGNTKHGAPEEKVERRGRTRPSSL